MKKLFAIKTRFSNYWTLVVVPLLAFVANLVLSEVQESMGYVVILLSLAFLILLFAGIMLAHQKVISDVLKKTVYPRFEVAVNQPALDSGNYEHLFETSIITDRQLSVMEANCTFDEIWVISNDLATEIDGGLYADIVPKNLERGIKYKVFSSQNNLTRIRMESLKKKYNNSPNVNYYMLSDDFFFLVSKIDFTIYNPYKTSATGRQGYIGMYLPDGNELYEIRIGDDLVDAIASRLLGYIQNEKSEQVCRSDYNG